MYRLFYNIYIYIFKKITTVKMYGFYTIYTV